MNAKNIQQNIQKNILTLKVALETQVMKGTDKNKTHQMDSIRETPSLDTCRGATVRELHSIVAGIRAAITADNIGSTVNNKPKTTGSNTSGSKTKDYKIRKCKTNRYRINKCKINNNVCKMSNNNSYNNNKINNSNYKINNSNYKINSYNSSCRTIKYKVNKCNKGKMSLNNKCFPNQTGLI